MQGHYWEKAIGYEANISKGQEVKPFRAPVDDRLYIRGMLFGGFRHCLYPTQKFDNDVERRFAILLEDAGQELKWFEPARGQFRIDYKDGHLYEPDFVVETSAEKLIIEIKRASEVDNAEVQAKADAATTWCRYATQHEMEHDGKPWKYVLIPHDSVSASATLERLVAEFRINCSNIQVVQSQSKDGELLSSARFRVDPRRVDRF